jgi:hypothetical protein
MPQLPDISDLLESPAPRRPARTRAPRPAAQSPDISDLLDSPRKSSRRANSTPLPPVDSRLDEFVGGVIGEASKRSGFTYKLGEGSRTPAQQAVKVAGGFSRTYNSKHLHGRGRDVLAFDDKGNYIKDGRHPAYNVLGEVYRERSASAPVKWGGDFESFYDPGHFELTDGGAPASTLPYIADLLDSPDAAGAADDVVSTTTQVPRLGVLPQTPAPSFPSLTPRRPNVNTSAGRLQRDADKSASVVTLDVPLPSGARDWSEVSSADAGKQTARIYAASKGIPPEFVEKWAAANTDRLGWLDPQTRRPVEPKDFMGDESVYDVTRRLFRIPAETPMLRKLESDYQASLSLPARAGVRLKQAASDTSAGEHALGVAKALPPTVSRIFRPVRALDDAVLTKVRGGSDVEMGIAVTNALQGGEELPFAANPLGEGAEYLGNKVHPTVGKVARFATEMIASPSNLIPLAVFSKGGRLSRLAGGADEAARMARGVLRKRGVRPAEFEGRILVDSDTGKRFLEDAQGRFVVDLDTGEDASSVVTRSSLSAVEEEMLEEGIKRSAKLDPDLVWRARRGVPDGYEMVDGMYVPRPAEAPRTSSLSPSDPLDEMLAELSPNARAFRDAQFAGPSAGRSRLARAGHVADETNNLLRANAASADVSVPLRQTIIPLLTRPHITARALLKGLKAARPASADAIRAEVEAMPRFGVMQGSGLKLEALGEGTEFFRGAWGRRLPHVRGSQRIADAQLDLTRARLFDRQAERLERAGMTFETHPQQFRDFAKVVNTITGHGEYGPRSAKYLRPVLNRVLFGPHLLKSRVDLLFNPLFYAKLTPQARRFAALQMGQFVGTVGALMGGAAAAGYRVGWNPNSSGFGSVQIGDARYDLTGGFAPKLRAMFRFGASFGKDEPGVSGRDNAPLLVALHFGRSQLSPGASLAPDVATGKTFNDEPATAAQLAADRIPPLSGQSLYEGWVNAGGVTAGEAFKEIKAGEGGKIARQTGFAGALRGLPSLVGSSTYFVEDSKEAKKEAALRREVGGAEPPKVGARQAPARSAEPPPTLDADVARELERVRVNLSDLSPGSSVKRRASASKGYKVRSASGDSVKAFGGWEESEGMGLDVGAVNAEMAAEVNDALRSAINSPGYSAFKYDYQRKAHLERIARNVSARAMKGVRREARGAGIRKSRELEDYGRRLEARGRP